MKVVYLNPSGEIGGAEASLLTLIRTLLDNYPGFEPHVIATAAGPLTERCANLGIPFDVVELSRRLQEVGDAPTRGNAWNAVSSCFSLASGTAELAGYVRRLSRAVSRQQPELIHTNGFKMHLAGLLLRGTGHRYPVPVVGHIHDYVSRRPLAGRILRIASSRFLCFVANSKSVAHDITCFLKTDRVRTIYNAVDTDRFSPHGTALDLDRACGMPPAPAGTIRIGLAATFARWKGHLTFLRALRKLDPRYPVRGYVIGGPIYRTAGSQFSLEELQNEAARLGLQHKVGFTGLLANTAEALRALDIVVHASTDPEPFGLAIIEAMACGKPTIVSNAGGAAELFEEATTGLGHRSGDVEDLALQIERLTADPTLRESMGRTARESVITRFRPAEMASAFWRLYNSAMVERAKKLCMIAGD